MTETGRSAVRRLTLTNFRSYATARLDVGPGPVVLVGPNGAGKTNLLEAVSLLVPGRGLRRARLAELMQRGTGAAWAVAARLDTPAGEIDIGTGRDISAPDGSERRLVRINGVAARSQTALAEHASAVWLTPQMDRLFLESASGRRRFLDRLVYAHDSAHAARVSGYENAMRQRARILRDGPRDLAWLRTLEDSMATHGVAVAVARRAFAASLNEAMERRIVAAFPAARVTSAGTVEDWLETMQEADAAARFRETLAQGRYRDGEMGGASVGPHRSDMEVMERERELPAGQCSTGEQKALLIALMLSAARLLAALRHAPPLLLLDEVAAHLDSGRRAALFEEICGLGAQAWLTGTDAEIFTPFGRRAQFFRVQESRLTPI